MLLTRMLPSNAGKNVVFVILYDFLACGLSNFIELGGVLLPAQTRERKASFSCEARQKNKCMIERNDFRWLGPAAINTPSSSLQTSH